MPDDRKSRHRKPAPPEAIPTAASLPSVDFAGRAFSLRRPGTRLHDADYASPECLCFVTFCEERCRWRRIAAPTQSCALVWTVAQQAQILAAFVLSAQERGGRLDAVCVMGDHVHALLAPSGQGETIQDIVRRAKGRAMAASRGKPGPAIRWQRGMYDHILRPSERSGDEYGSILRYIVENPVKAGLVERCQDYPATWVSEQARGELGSA